MNNVVLEPNGRGGWMVKVNGLPVAAFSSRHVAEDTVRWLTARMDQWQRRGTPNR
jgi:hypothetical protein